MVSSVVSGTGTVGNIQTAAVSRNTGSSTSNDFKSVMAASLASNASGTKLGTAGNKLNAADTVKKDTQSQSQAVNNNNSKTTDKNPVEKTSDIRKNVDDDKLNSKVNEAVNDVRETIKEELDVSDEDIAKAMEVLGMTANDLLSVVKVTELVGELTGTDSLTLITDDNMLNKLTSVLDVVNSAHQDIADMLGTDTDSVPDIISAVKVEAVADDDRKTSDKSNTDDVISEQNADVKESLSDVLAKKITTDNQDNQNPQTGGQKHSTESYGSVADNMLQNISESFADIITEDTSYVSEADIVKQVIDQVKLTSGRELTSIEVMLNPERLGSVHVTVTAKNGILSAQIAASNEQVKTALENQMTALKENFQNQGIKVDAVEITVMTHQFEAGQNFGQSESERKQSERKMNKKLDLSAYEDDEDEISTEEIRKNASISNGNSSVEYTA